jgi:hypothetical protein
VGFTTIGVPVNFTSSDLNAAALTVFGEVSSHVTSNARAEAFAVASEIFNRSIAIMQGANFGTTGGASLSNVVAAPSQFAGYAKGQNDYKNFSAAPQKNEFREGERNCERIKTAFNAVSTIATNLKARDPYLCNYSNFAGKRNLRAGEIRINGNDFSENPMQP